ncbi:hypothetical protein [Desulfobulbus alkaliphilus]|uniref:hypothetical protein n=1 Tax=Desulfobulbus alkaliphilus TaxID=869814 RepID=UPI0019644A17|nr:hypothetical protein [Desulfobulbus alkaliphilus]MBM9536472.1 hypothetical protein [Desulfobulbus alkaliphilus]
MEQVLAGGLGLILLLVGIVATVTVGVTAILLPFLVFRILSHVAQLNRKMNKVLDLLSSASLGESRQQPAIEGRSGPSVREDTGPEEEREQKPLRFR